MKSRKFRAFVLVGALAALVSGLGGGSTYASADCPSVPSSVARSADGFLSPYLGHTGANQGSGSDFAGGFATKLAQMDLEVQMGIRWTFLPVHWSLIEPAKPTAPPPAPLAAGSTGEPADPWHQLDRFVRAAHERGLHIFLQVVIGGNGGGPPGWAGRRVSDKSAPAFMDGTETGADGQGLVPFVGKLATRFRPGGSLAQADGWTDGYGVRAWLMDNEPDGYQTNWDSVADDYAEFVVKSSAKIKAIDPAALIVADETAEGEAEMPFTTAVLQSGVQQASPTYEANGIDYVAGPHIDIVSFHSYELLGFVFSNRALDGDDLAVQQLMKAFRNVKAKFAEFEDQPGFAYAPKTEYWHTEGGFGFIADDPQAKRNWVNQWLAQGFAAGVTRLSIMDASTEEALSVHTMTCLLPDPFPIENVTEAVGADPEQVMVFRVARSGDGGWTYIAWARSGVANVFGATVTLPVRGLGVRSVSVTGAVTPLSPTGGRVTLQLPAQGLPFNEPVFVVDDPAPRGSSKARGRH